MDRRRAGSSILLEATHPPSHLSPLSSPGELARGQPSALINPTESAEDLQEKCTELNQAWSSLGKRADQRKAKLGGSRDLQRFLSDFR